MFFSHSLISTERVVRGGDFRGADLLLYLFGYSFVFSSDPPQVHVARKRCLVVSRGGKSFEISPNRYRKKRTLFTVPMAMATRCQC